MKTNHQFPEPNCTNLYSEKYMVQRNCVVNVFFVWTFDLCIKPLLQIYLCKEPVENIYVDLHMKILLFCSGLSFTIKLLNL